MSFSNPSAGSTVVVIAVVLHTHTALKLDTYWPIGTYAYRRWGQYGWKYTQNIIRQTLL